MNKRFTKLIAALALLVGLTIPLGMWGQTRSEVNYVFSDHYSSNTVLDETPIAFDGVITATFNKRSGGTATQYYTNGSAVRWYGGGTLEIVASDATISNIEITYTQTANTVSASVGTYSLSNSVGTWSGSTSSVIFTQSGTTGQCRISAIKVTYSAGGSSAVATTVTIDATGITNTDVHSSTAAGQLTATVTYDNNGTTTNVPNATVAWSSSNENVATIDEDGVVTLVAAGTTTITASYAGEAGVYAASSATYELEVTDSTPFTGGDVTFVCGEDMSETMSLSKNGVTMEFESSGGTWNRTDNYRLYSGKSMTISTSNGTITSIAFEISQNNFSGDGYNAETKIWTGNAETITLAADGGQVRFTPVVVTVNMSGTPDPSITASNVSIEYDATEGEIAYTVENPVDGATVVATTTAEWLTIGTIGETVPFTCSANTETSARTATVTLNYVKNGETLATKDVTVTQAAAPVVYTTIPALFEAATSTATDVIITFGSWVISAVHNSNAYLTDNQGHGLIIYASNHGFQVNDVLTGTVSCKLQTYRGSAELTNLTSSTEGLSVVNNGTVAEQDIAINTLGGVNTGALLAYQGLTYNGTSLVDGNNNTITPYSTLYSYTFEAGKTYNVKGIYLQYNDTKEILPRSAEDIEEVVVTEPSITVSPSEITVNAEYHQDVLTVTYENLDPTSSNPVAIFYDAEGHETNCSWLWVELQSDWNFRYTIFANEGEARTAYFKIRCNGVYSEMVTVSQAAYVAPVTGDKYVKVASADDLTDGQYLIVYEEGSVAFNGGLETLDATSNTIEVTISNNEIAVAETTAAAEFTIDVTNGTLKSASGKYIGVSTNSNGLKQTDDASTYTNSFSIDESGNAVIAAVFEGSSMTLRYNSASNQNRFRYYTSGQKAIQLYKKAEATPTGPTITVNGYGDTDGGYVLIASPTVEYANPMTIGMATGNYDLYYFDAEQELEWRNYKAQDGGNYNLEPGKGYLYANQETVTITFTGDMNPSFSDVELPYTENDVIKSLYLAGNSSTQAQTFYVNDGNFDHQTFNYLTINEDGNGFISAQATSYTAPAMTGFFVQAPGEGMALSTYDINAKANVSLLNINVLRDRGSIIDNAIVSFSNGSMMDKFYLKNNTTRVYIPQGNREMAIANSAAQGEMPVSFRAAENGTYTLSIETENVEMDYLHLIDNMTGMDVDLLATPSYTFEAKTTDYASRFRLVFSANGIDEQNAEAFAYFNGSEWMVSNLGESTLQVVDVMGRVLSTETISGNAELSLNQPAGVYMLRLINGNDVKVQKVIVK